MNATKVLICLSLSPHTGCNVLRAVVDKHFTEHADTHVMYHIMDVLLLYAVIKPLIEP